MELDQIQKIFKMPLLSLMDRFTYWNIWIIIVYLSFTITCEGKLSYREALNLINNVEDARLHPYYATGEVVNASLGAYILNLHSLSEDSMELEMTAYLRMIWYDSRLTLPPDAGWDKGIDITDSASIWMPEVFAPNSKEMKIHQGTTYNALIKILPGGKVFGSVKVGLVTTCSMDLSAFPFDSQICEIRFESYKDTTEQMTIAWVPNGVMVAPFTNPIAFHYKSLELKKEAHVYSVGTYERLIMRFQFKRISSHYVLFIYVPSTLLVILGGLLFWLPQGALAERTSYSAFLFLAMVLLSACSQYAAPQVGYVKAIDAWCATCTLFLFAAITEILILHLLRVHQQQKNAESFQELKEEPEGVQETERDTSFLTSKLVLFRNPKVVYWIDMVLRAMYPAIFVLFIIVYASVYH